MMSFFQAVVTGGPMGQIHVTTQKPYYVAGELVQGTIHLDAKAPFSANGIDLKVTGYEKVEWHDRSTRTETLKPAYTDSQGRHHAAQTRQIPQLRRRRAKKTFFNQQMRIYNIQGGMMNPGTYTFPFQYQLPDNIPGSFYERTPLGNVQAGTEFLDEDGFNLEAFYDSDDEYEGRMGRGASFYQRSAVLAAIMYKLKVTLDLNGIFLPDLHAKMPLIVHPKLEVNLQPAMQTITQQVTVCCCINKGNCTVEARFDKLAYVAGETADVRCDVKNESTSDLGTRVILRRYLTLRANNSTKRIVEDIVQQQYDVVKGGENSMDRRMPLQLTGEKVKPTTSGNHVTCTYEYLVECSVSMGSDLYLKMPVTVYAPQPPPLQLPGSPAAGAVAPMPMHMHSQPQQQQMMGQPQTMGQPMMGQPMGQQQPMMGQQQMMGQQPMMGQPMMQQQY